MTAQAAQKNNSQTPAAQPSTAERLVEQSEAMKKNLWAKLKGEWIWKDYKGPWYKNKKLWFALVGALALIATGAALVSPAGPAVVTMMTVSFAMFIVTGAILTGIAIKSSYDFTQKPVDKEASQKTYTPGTQQNATQKSTLAEKNQGSVRQHNPHPQNLGKMVGGMHIAPDGKQTNLHLYLCPQVQVQRGATVDQPAATASSQYSFRA